MKLTSKKAYELLLEAQKLNPGRWVEHSKRVGEAAARIAEKLNLDTDKAKALGYIHDIGKRFGENSSHTISGYEYLKDLGYEEYSFICLTHSYLYNDINCVAGGFPNVISEKEKFRKSFVESHTYTLYDKIINLCDLFCTTKFVTIEKRLIDIYSRRGVFENTVYHIKKTFELKEEIEELLGCSLYSLFPEMKEYL